MAEPDIERLSWSQAKLEEDAFQFFLNRIRADVNAYVAWQKQCSDFNAAGYAKEKQFYMTRYNHAKELAETWIKDKVVITSGEVTTASRILANQITDAKTAFMNRHTIRGMSIAMVVNLKWASPGLLRSEHQTLQQALKIDILDAAPEQNVAVMMMPELAYTPGTLCACKYQF